MESHCFSTQDEVNLLEANPQYAHVQFPDGREDTVSIKHLAPLGDKEVPVESDNQSSPVDTPQIVVDSPPSIFSRHSANRSGNPSAKHR